MRRVLQVCVDPGISYGGGKGAAVHLTELAGAFAGHGVEVLMVVARIEPDAPPPPPGVSVETMPGPGRGTLDERLAAEPARAAWLAERARTWGADVIYERFALHTTAGLDAARAVGIPHLVELNAPLPAEASRYRSLEEPRLAEQLERRIYRGTDAVLAVSRPLAEYAAARGAHRVVVSANAVDPSRFPTPADAGADEPTAVFVGSLRPWHGADTLAVAWSMLGSDAPRLLVVGDGMGRDVLEDIGAEITGMVEPARVPPLVASAQIGLAPYPADAPDYFSPLKVYEYLAAGLAVVGADLPGIADTAAGCAVLVPAGDPGALAYAVGELAADPARRARLGTAARDTVTEHHTWRRRAESILVLASDLAFCPPPRRLAHR